MQVDEIAWEQDPELDPGKGEVAKVGVYKMGVWSDARGVERFDVWDLSTDAEVIEGEVVSCAPLEPRTAAKRMATSFLLKHIAGKAVN